MKKIILTLTLALSTTASAFAAERAPMSKLCPIIAEFANVVMVARQNGYPMRKVMGLDEGSDIMVSMITEAYSSHAYNTQEYKEIAIQDFEDQWYLRCVKSYDL